MRLNVSQFCGLDGKIGRSSYLLAGVLLFAIKFGLDWTIANLFFGRSWSPMSYLIWPDVEALRILDLPEKDRRFALALLLVSIPFIWTGVVLTVQRLRAIQLPLGLVAFFFVPVVNWFLFLVLSLMPSRPTSETQMELSQRLWSSSVRKKIQRAIGENTIGSAILALVISLPTTIGLVAFAATSLGSYGYGVFVGAPFFLGLISTALFGLSRPRSFGSCIVLSLVTTTLVGVGIFIVAMEGMICLLMAAPIAFGLSTFGAIVGYIIQSREWVSDQTPTLCVGLLVLLPSLMAAEATTEKEPVEREICTSVVIDATPETVWQHVIAFSPLPEPEDWLFGSGIAYPQRAEIQGTGVGAVRYCVFSTGAFVEPIDVWSPPHLLCFRVTEQPPSMQEWSPFEIHPAHLDHYFVSKRGQFRLKELPGGRTLLEGTTWYTNKMRPGPYWNLWSDYIIHRIHGRVLEHIQGLAESRS